MIAPAKAGKFTLYRAERQGFAAERAVAKKMMPLPGPVAREPHHFQHITAVPQRNRAEQCKVTENERVALDRSAHGQIFEHLGNSLDSVVGRVGQNVDGCLGIQEQGGHVTAVAGERLEAVIRMRSWLYIRRIGMK